MRRRINEKFPRLVLANTLALLLVLMAFPAYTQTVTSVTYDSLSHSVIRIDFQTSAKFNYGHVRYIDTTNNPGAVCTEGRGGVVQPTEYTYTAGPTYGSYQMVIGGLTPGHTYSFCPEVSKTNGDYSRGGAYVSATMASLPAIHPAPPIAPATFSTAYPSDMGRYPTLTLGTSSGCLTLQACLTTAIMNQASNGTIISVPAGVSAASIGGVGPFGSCGNACFPTSRDVVTLTSSQVSSSTVLASGSAAHNSFHVVGHGLAEGSQTVWGANYGCLPGDYTANPSRCKEAGNDKPIPFGRNIRYNVHVLGKNDFQLYTCPGANNGTAPSCAFSAGTLLTFADRGNGKIEYAPWPRFGGRHWIIVRTSTPDSKFVPPGSLVEGPPDGTGVPTRPAEWVPLMGNLQVAPGAEALITLGDQNSDPMTTNIRFIGIHFSYTDTSEPSVSGDPTPGSTLFYTDLDTSNIIWDRNYFDAPATPFRVSNFFVWNGLNTAFINNYAAGMEVWSQNIAGEAVTGSGTTVSIASGVNRFGAGTGALSNPVSLRLSGASLHGQQRMFLDFSMNGTLNIIPPPGIRVAVSGISKYHVVTPKGYDYPAGSAGPTLNDVGTKNLRLPPHPGNDNYYADPVVSTSASCATTSSLLGDLHVNTPPAFATKPPGGNFGLQWTSDTNQYLCGVRFYKHPSDRETTHTVGAWNAAGALLASASTARESASGWQTARFSTPVAIASATEYEVAYHTTYGWPYTAAEFQNSDLYANHLHLTGSYVPSNGSGGYGDSWPRDYLGNVAVGILGFVDISPGGTVVGAGNANIGYDHGNANCNCMIGGLGPGPYMMVGNFSSGAGLPWHFDNSGARWALRGDYTISRNYFYGPPYTLYGTASSNGMDYVWRQPLEWKGGNRIQIYGNTFDGSDREAGSIAMIALQSPGEVNCITDADVMYNIFKHGPGTLSGGIEYGGGAPMSCPPVRTRFAQNVSWDISGAYQPGGSGVGFWLGGQIGAEDVIIDHNTDADRSGVKPVFWDLPEFKMEGIQITNNILQIDRLDGGLEEDPSSYQTTDSCARLTAKAMADCKFTPSYTMKDNVLLALGGATQIELQHFYPPPLVNYIPDQDLYAQQGFVQMQKRYSLSTPLPDVRFGSTSNGPSSSRGPSGGREESGAQADLVLAKQGRVTASANPTGAGAANITVDQPDFGTCTLDYGTEPTVTKFTRVSQTCRPGRVTFHLAGLAAGQVYHFRYDGAVQQPTGHFKAR